VVWSVRKATQYLCIAAAGGHAHATPVVAWDLPVFRSIVNHGKTGMLADTAGGPCALAGSILQVLRDTETAMQMGEAGRRLATSIYSWEGGRASLCKGLRIRRAACKDDVSSSSEYQVLFSILPKLVAHCGHSIFVISLRWSESRFIGATHSLVQGWKIYQSERIACSVRALAGFRKCLFAP
jgi:Glycosyl transferases group 1